MRGVFMTKISSAMRRFVAMHSMVSQPVAHLVWGYCLAEEWRDGYGHLGSSQLPIAHQPSHLVQATRRAQSWWVCFRRWSLQLLGEHQ